MLDEPTNDLDVETLELLEDIIAEYEGTLLIVSHDRAFLDNVVTSTLVFEGNGRIGEYVGGYRDWVAQRPPIEKGQTVPIKVSEPANDAIKPDPARNKKLSYKEQKELNDLPAHIEALEEEQGELQRLMAGSDFYRRDKTEITAALARAEELKCKLDEAYGRWQVLDAAAVSAK